MMRKLKHHEGLFLRGCGAARKRRGDTQNVGACRIGPVAAAWARHVARVPGPVVRRCGRWGAGPGGTWATLQSMTENPALAAGAPRRTRTGVVARETDAECALDRVHGIILRRRRGRGIGPWSDVGCRRERTTVCQVLKCSLVHEDAPAVDR